MTEHPTFAQFIDHLRSDEHSCRVAAELVRQGVKLNYVFADLVVYLEGLSIKPERRKRGAQTRRIINESTRHNGLDPTVARWLQNRWQLAYALKPLGRARNLDALTALHIYLEETTNRKVTMAELTVLVDAANGARGDRDTYTDPIQLGQNLRRHARKNANFIQLLRADIRAKVAAKRTGT